MIEIITALSKVNLVNKYRPTKLVTTIDKNKKEALKEVPNYWCEIGDFLIVITKNPAEWQIVVAVKNAKEEKFSIRYEYLDFDYLGSFSLDDEEPFTL